MNARKYSYDKFEELNAQLEKEFELDLSNELEQYIHRDPNFNRIQPVMTWCMRQKQTTGRTLSNVTENANFVTDRTSLSKIATTPYEDRTFGWKLQCRRIGKTIFMCPYKVLEENEHFNSPLQQENSYVREKLRNIVTMPYSDFKNMESPYLNPNNSYHHVNLVELCNKEESAQFSVLYASQVDILKKGKPVEIRCHTGNFGAGKAWRSKTMKWYFQFVFSGADEVIIARKSRDHLKIEFIDEVPTKIFRAEAEENMWWTQNGCLSFLFEVLKEVHEKLHNLPEGKALVVTHNPQSTNVIFEVRDDEPNFIPFEFTQTFPNL
uniref:Decapping nuclease n=1 Tax=Acrobeloides nanus TaxID=290746 RepID=A0A914CBQ7_9BILA